MSNICLSLMESCKKEIMQILRLMLISVLPVIYIDAVLADSAKPAIGYEKIEYKKPLQLNISSQGINRISIRPHIATMIWGDDSMYSAALSGNGSEIFLTSKVEAGNNVIIAVELVNHSALQVQSLSLQH